MMTLDLYIFCFSSALSLFISSMPLSTFLLFFSLAFLPSPLFVFRQRFRKRSLGEFAWQIYRPTESIKTFTLYLLNISVKMNLF